jgi:hypothetical protein
MATITCTMCKHTEREYGNGMCYKCYYEDDYERHCGICSVCENTDYLCADEMCADCYWDADYERKQARRADPVWRFNRIVSFCMTCMGMNTEAAIAYALKQLNLRDPP